MSNSTSPSNYLEATRAALDKPAPSALAIAMADAVARFSGHKPVSAYHAALLSRLAVDPQRKRGD